MTARNGYCLLFEEFPLGCSEAEGSTREDVYCESLLAELALICCLELSLTVICRVAGHVGLEK